MGKILRILTSILIAIPTIGLVWWLSAIFKFGFSSYPVFLDWLEFMILALPGGVILYGAILQSQLKHAGIFFHL